MSVLRSSERSASVRAMTLVPVLVAAVVVAGCSSSGPTSPRNGADTRVTPDTNQSVGPALVVSDVAAVVSQTREDIAAGARFQVLLTNAGSSPFTLTSVALSSPGFEPAAASVRHDLFPPGVRYALPTAYGEARCDSEPLPAQARVVLHREGGPHVRLLVPLTSKDGLLQRIHDGECRERDLHSRVGVELVGLAPDGDVLRGHLRLTRGRQVGSVTLTELRGTVLFGWGPRDPAVLGADGSRVDVPVSIGTLTCSGHVIGETKQPYLFSAYLSLGGEPPTALKIPVSQAQKDALQALLRRVC